MSSLHRILKKFKAVRRKEPVDKFDIDQYYFALEKVGVIRVLRVLKRESGANPELTRSGNRERRFTKTLCLIHGKSNLRWQHDC